MSVNINDVRDWIVSHNSDYGRVRSRLEYVRNIVMHGPIEAASRVLRLSYVNAVLSIQTGKDRHESAFVAYTNGATFDDLATQVVYGGHKKNWMNRTFEAVCWESLARAVRIHVRRGRYSDLLQAVVDNLTGVAHRKGAFMLAMSGLYEFMCIDSNVAKFADIEQGSDFANADEYMARCELVRESVAGDNPYLPPFIVQWAIYDCVRGEHARHMVYFNEVLGR
jgi:hypothetical protein